MKSRAVSTLLCTYIVSAFFGIVLLGVMYCQCSYLAVGNSVVPLSILWAGFTSCRFVLLVSSLVFVISIKNREQKIVSLFCFVMTFALSVFIALTPLLYGGEEGYLITYHKFIENVLTKRDGFPATLIMLFNCIFYGCFLFNGVPHNTYID